MTGRVIKKCVRELQNRGKELNELLVVINPVKDEIKAEKSKISTFEEEALSILDGRRKMHQSNFLSALIVDPVEDIKPLFDLMIQRIIDLEQRRSNPRPACDWEGGKWIFGDRGCEDDVYMVCRNGILMGIEQGCE